VTSRFPGPWRIAEFPNGFAVYDATGRQLGFFYGRASPNPSGHTGFLTIDEAREIAIDFTRLQELLNQTPVRSEVATSTEGDKLAKLETNPSPQGVSEASRLPRAAQLSVTPVTGLPLFKAPTTIPRSISFEPNRQRSAQMLRRRSDPRSIRTKFLIAIAVAALPVGYFVFGSSDRPVDVAVAPRYPAAIPPEEFLPLREAQAPAAIPPEEFLPLREAQAPAAAAVSTNAESRIEPEVQTAPLQPTVPLDIKQTENGIEARPPQTLPQKEGQSLTPSQDASTCFPSASAVRENYPGGWPSWTLNAPGHEGARCWYPATRTTAHDHRNEMRKKETAAGVKKDDDTSVAAIVAKNDDREPAPSALSNDANFYRDRGVAAYRSGDFLGAIGNFDEAIRLNPNDAQSYNIRGNVWDELGIYERALADYDKAIRIDPNNPVVFHDRAILWYRKGALDEALLDLDRAIRFSFSDVNIYCDRGLVWYQKGQHDRAIADFNQAIKLDPSFAAAYLNRGLILHRNKGFNDAFAAVFPAIRVDPKIFDVNRRANMWP
jgi:tetratricopeptide (TPR) repeat protein